MIPEEQRKLQWTQLITNISRLKNIQPELDDILVYIGEKESGLPPKPAYTDREIAELIQLAISTVLVPARYYELFWVEDTGWPHYRQLQRVPPMSDEDRLQFLQPWIIRYAKKNKLI